MSDSEAIAYLLSLQQFGIKLGLDNIRALLHRLGSPERAYPSLLITGSNGKGSVAAMLTGCLVAAGHRVGTYTSPHLVALEERIAIDGRPISRRRLTGAVGQVRAVIDDLLRSGGLRQHPTFFEVVTAAAFTELARARVDVAVLEVGLGGRFDATNAADPAVSVLTNVELEHTRYLGATVADIAFEKAAIARPGRPLVIGVGGGPTLSILRGEARRRQAVLHVAPRRVRVIVEADTRAGLRLRVHSPRGQYPRLQVPLPGRHQARNAATAIAALEALPAELRPSPTEIAAGLRATRWPGRLEYVAARPRLLLDGAHNPPAAAHLASYLRRHERRSSSVLLFACMGDKEIRGLLGPLVGRAARVVLTRVDNPRAANLDELTAAIAATGDRAAEQVADPAEALRRARRLAGPTGLVVVCGSLYLVGAIKEVLAREARRGGTAKA